MFHYVYNVCVLTCICFIVFGVCCHVPVHSRYVWIISEWWLVVSLRCVISAWSFLMGYVCVVVFTCLTCFMVCLVFVFYVFGVTIQLFRVCAFCIGQCVVLCIFWFVIWSNSQSFVFSVLLSIAHVQSPLLNASFHITFVNGSTRSFIHHFIWNVPFQFVAIPG